MDGHVRIEQFRHYTGLTIVEQHRSHYANGAKAH